jgi:hypothetical protein
MDVAVKHQVGTSGPVYIPDFLTFPTPTLGWTAIARETMGVLQPRPFGQDDATGTSISQKGAQRPICIEETGQSLIDLVPVASSCPNGRPMH